MAGISRGWDRRRECQWKDWLRRRAAWRYDLTSLDTASGELRLIEVKGLAAGDGPIIITPNEHRVAEDRRDCYWLYVVTDCATDQPKLRTHQDPARFGWREVTQVAHYTLPSGAMAGHQVE